MGLQIKFQVGFVRDISVTSDLFPADVIKDRLDSFECMAADDCTGVGTEVA